MINKLTHQHRVRLLSLHMDLHVSDRGQPDLLYDKMLIFLSCRLHRENQSVIALIFTAADPIDYFNDPITFIAADYRNLQAFTVNVCKCFPLMN